MFAALTGQLSLDPRSLPAAYFQQRAGRHFQVARRLLPPSGGAPFNAIGVAGTPCPFLRG